MVELIVLACLILGYLFIANFSVSFGFKKLGLHLWEANPFLGVFYRVIIFSFLLVSVYAILLTTGKTIFVFVIPLIYVLIKSYRSKNTVLSSSPHTITNRTVWLSIGLVSLLTILLSYYFTLKFSIRNDTAHYVKIGEYMATYGVENPYHYYNAENDLFRGIAPYHYFEMWFGGIFYKLNGLLGFNLFSNYLLYIYFVFNLFRVLVIIGIFGLLFKYVKFNALYFLITIPVLIIDISAYCNWWIDSYVAESNLFERPNFIFYYLFMIPVFDSVLNNDRTQQTIWSAFFIVASITALPAIAGSLLLKFAYDWYKQKEERKTIVRITILFLGFIVLIAIFYKLFGVTKEAMTIESMSIKQMVAKTLSLWKACVFMFTMLSVKIAFFIGLIFLLIWNRFSKDYTFDSSFKQLLLYVTLLCFTGIGLFQIVPYLDNMYQFAFIGYCAVVLLLIVILIIKLSTTISKIKMYGSLSLILIILFIGFKRNLFYDHILLADVNWKVDLKTNFLMQHGLSYKYIKSLEENASELKNKNGASLIDGEDAITDFLGLRHSVTYQLGNYLMVYNNYIHLPLLSDKTKLYPDTDTLSKDYYKALNFNGKALFYRTYNDSLSYNLNLKKYITDHNISYIFASKSVIPAKYLDSTTVLKVIKDMNKGHQLIILKSAEK